MKHVGMIRLAFWGICLLAGLPVSGLAADATLSVRLIVEDVMVHPGKPARLQARLIQDGPSGGKGMPGETIRFEVQGQKAGAAVTGQDGLASVEFTSHMRGNQVIKGIVESSAHVQPAEALGNFASWERRRPLLLVELETLLKQPAVLGNIGASGSLTQTINALGPAEERAPFELTKLGEYYYNIIYLYRGQQAAHRDAIRIWLQDHQFPPGITKVLSPGSHSLQAFIQSIKEQGWDNIEAGIGLSQDFAETLVKHRITAVILQAAPTDEKFPRRTKFVPAWEKIRRFL